MAHKKQKLDLFSVNGVSGLKENFGQIEQDKFSKLQGQPLNCILKEMADNDPTIGAMLFYVNNIMAGVGWRIEAADDSDKAEEYRQFLEECIDDMSHTWQDLMDEVATMFVFGFAPMEVTYKRRRGDNEDGRFRSKFNDNKLAVRKIELRAQESIVEWERDDDGGVTGFFQESDSGDNRRPYVPIEKTLLFRTIRNKNNPEGRSLFRNAVVPYCYKKSFQELEAIKIERDAAGFPVFEVPPEILEVTDDAEEAAARRSMVSCLYDVVCNIRTDSLMGAVIPGEFNCEGERTGYKLRLLGGSGSSKESVSISVAIDRHDLAIALSSMMGLIFLGHRSTGSRSMLDANINMFKSMMQKYINSVQDTLNRFLVPPLMRGNGYDQKLSPKFVADKLTHPDLKEIGEFIKALTVAGMDVTDGDTQRFLRNASGMPVLTDDEIEEMDDLAGV